MVWRRLLPRRFFGKLWYQRSSLSLSSIVIRPPRGGYLPPASLMRNPSSLLSPSEYTGRPSRLAGVPYSVIEADAELVDGLESSARQRVRSIIGRYLAFLYEWGADVTTVIIYCSARG